MKNEITILVIEDDPIIAHSIKLLLEDLGYNVALVCNKFELAIEALDKVYYDLVITDINLGHGIDEKSGIVLMKHLRKTKKCPFIFLTAFGDKETVKQAATCFPSAYLVKPINEMNLQVAIQLAIENFTNLISPEYRQAEVRETDFVYVKLGKRLVKILWKDVTWMQVLKNYIKLFTAEYKGGVLVRGSMQNIMDLMMPENLKKKFIRVNRAIVVSKDQVTEIGNGYIITPFGRFETSIKPSQIV